MAQLIIGVLLIKFNIKAITNFINSFFFIYYMPKALFIGRFQPLHNAHLEVIKNILKENDKIVIAIGSSQESNTKENPFSAAERKEMFDAVMKGNKITNYEIAEIPDFFDDDKWCGYIKNNLKNIDVAYSGNKYVINCLTRHGFKVKTVGMIEGINSTKIRDMIKNGSDKWEELVPEEVAEIMERNSGIERIKSL